MTGRARRLTLGLLSLVLAACQAQGPHRILVPGGFARSTSFGDHESGAADLSVAAEVIPDQQVHLPTRMLFDLDGGTSPWIEWLPLGFKNEEQGGWRTSSSAELIAGLHQRLVPALDSGSMAPALSAEIFTIFPHGGPKAPRWQGVVEGEEGTYARIAADWGNAERSLVVNLGGGVGGQPGDPGHSGRGLASAVLTQGLPATGLGYSTERSRLSLETSWVVDPVDDRTYGELHVGLSLWLGITELDVGYRRGLTTETEDNVFYVGFRGRLFDTLSL